MNNLAIRLQPLIKLRKATRDERRADLAKAYQAEQILQQRIDHIQTDIEQTRKDVHSMSEPGELNVDQILHGQRYEMLLKLQQREIEQQQEQLQVEVERRRQALIEADRELRVLEKLQEKKMAELLAHEQKLESRHLDEVASRKYQWS